jgi:hypothetical protein
MIGWMLLSTTVVAALSVPLYWTVVVPVRDARSEADKVKEGEEEEEKEENSINGAGGSVRTDQRGSSSQKRLVRRGRIPTGALVWGYGVFVPLFVLAPGVVMRECVPFIQNKLFVFALCVVLPTTSIFRTLEAMYGYTPEYARRTLPQFVLYFASHMLLRHDPRTGRHIRCGWRDVLWQFAGVVGWVLVTGLFQSAFLWDRHHRLFPSVGMPLSEDPGTLAYSGSYYSVSSVFRPSQWKANAFRAVLFQLYLTTFAEGLRWCTTVLTGGIETHDVMRHPLRFYYGWPPGPAVVAAFMASGMFHEWLLPTAFGSDSHPDTNPIVVHGPTMSFFLWNAIVVLLEGVIGSWALFRWMQSSLPRPVRTALVIMLALPLAHWFMTPYTHSNFFVQAHQCLPLLLPVDGTTTTHVPAART